MTRQVEQNDASTIATRRTPSADEPGRVAAELTPPVMDRLQEATSGIHEAVEQLPFNQQLMAGDLEPEGYGAWLRALLAIHRGLEQAVRTCQDPTIEQVWSPDRYRADLLVEDLETLGLPVSPPDGEPSSAHREARRLADRLRSASPDALAGALYVFEGATLGGMMIARQLERRAPHLAEATAYYTAYGDRTRPMWTAFSEAMNEVLTAPDQIRRCLRSARGTFWGVGQVTRKLTEAVGD